MKTAISLPDKIHREADRLARRLKKSRSRLYADALTLYLARYDSEAITEALNELSDTTDTRLDADLRTHSFRNLEKAEW